MTLEAVSKRPQEQLTWTEIMKDLQGHIGNRVAIRYASDGSQGIRRGTLEEVEPFKGVKIDGFYIPFIGEGAALQQIIGDEILYHNPIIADTYDQRREKEIEGLRRFVFQGEDKTAEEILAF